MEIHVRPYRPIDYASRKVRDGGQYEILIDGQRKGFIGYHEGAAPMLLERRSQIELDEITEACREALPDQNLGETVQINRFQPPPKPERKPNDFD